MLRAFSDTRRGGSHGARPRSVRLDRVSSCLRRVRLPDRPRRLFRRGIPAREGAEPRTGGRPPRVFPFVVRAMILGFWWILITGSVLGYAGDWWAIRWFWAAIVTLIVLAGLMTPLAAKPYYRVRAIVGLRAPLRRKPLPTPPSNTDADLTAALDRISPIPAAAVGMIGIAFLLWL